MRAAWACAAVALGACLGGGLDGDAGPDDGGGRVTITVTAPALGAMIPRDYLTGDGSWVARVTFRAQTSQPVDHLEWVLGGSIVGTGFPPDYAFTTNLATDGQRSYDIVARDAAGGERGRATFPLRIVAPTAASGSCPAQLDALGVTFVDGPATPGVVTPVTVTLPLNDLAIRDAGGAAKRTLLLDCTLAVALWRAADVLRTQHVTAVTDLGLYAYRCVDGSVSPPACPGSTLSQHGLATAIDLGAFRHENGTEYIVTSGWLLDDIPDGQTTCTVVPRSGAQNQFLHQLLCELHQHRIFTVLLTPNAAAANADYFHLDLTPRDDRVVR